MNLSLAYLTFIAVTSQAQMPVQNPACKKAMAQFETSVQEAKKNCPSNPDDYQKFSRFRDKQKACQQDLVPAVQSYCSDNAQLKTCLETAKGRTEGGLRHAAAEYKLTMSGQEACLVNHVQTCQTQNRQLATSCAVWNEQVHRAFNDCEGQLHEAVMQARSHLATCQDPLSQEAFNQSYQESDGLIKVYSKYQKDQEKSNRDSMDQADGISVDFAKKTNVELRTISSQKAEGERIEIQVGTGEYNNYKPQQNK